MSTDIKRLKSRSIQKHDVEANWLQATGFVPYAGEIIVYDKDEAHDYVRFKIGDGNSNVNDLPFEVEKDLFEFEDRSHSEDGGTPWVNKGEYFIIKTKEASVDTCIIEAAMTDNEDDGTSWTEVELKTNQWHLFGDFFVGENADLATITDSDYNYFPHSVEVKHHKYATMDKVYTKEQADERHNELVAEHEELAAAHEELAAAHKELRGEITVAGSSVITIGNPIEPEDSEWPEFYDLKYTTYLVVADAEKMGGATATLNFVGFTDSDTFCQATITGIKNGSVIDLNNLVWTDTIDGLPVAEEVTIDYAEEVTRYILQLWEAERKYYSPDETYSKTEIDAEIYQAVSEKVDRADSTFSLPRAYCVEANGLNDTLITINVDASDASIVRRGTGGTVSVGTPTKSGHATTKAYVDEKFGYAKIPDTDIGWSTSSTAGTVSMLDAAMITSLNGNRLAFMPPEDITIEYSNDGGETWHDGGWSDTDKIDLTTETKNLITIRPWAKTASAPAASVSNQARITLTATTGKLYFIAKKLLIYYSTDGAKETKVRVEKSTIGEPDVFTEVGTYGISGWSGWNSIPLRMTFGGNSFQTDYTRKVRLTFTADTITADSQSFGINKIYALGDTMYSGSSQAQKNSLFVYDANKEATFPAQIQVPVEPTLNAHVATKRYVDSKVDPAVIRPQTLRGYYTGSSGAKDSGYWNAFTWTMKIAWGSKHVTLQICDINTGDIAGILDVQISTGREKNIVNTCSAKWLVTNGNVPEAITTHEVDADGNSVCRLYIALTKTYRVFGASQVYASLHNSENCIEQTTASYVDELVGEVKTRSTKDELVHRIINYNTSDRLYIEQKNNGGTQLIGFGASAEPWAIASRNGNGQASFGEPTEPAHATTKKYVDDALAQKRAIVTDVNEMLTPDGVRTDCFYKGTEEPMTVIINEGFNTFNGVPIKWKVVDELPEEGESFYYDDNGNPRFLFYYCRADKGMYGYYPIFRDDILDSVDHWEWRTLADIAQETDEGVIVKEIASLDEATDENVLYVVHLDGLNYYDGSTHRLVEKEELDAAVSSIFDGSIVYIFDCSDVGEP